jgi:esterase/lipase superfamily enzyme
MSKAGKSRRAARSRVPAGDFDPQLAGQAFDRWKHSDFARRSSPEQMFETSFGLGVALQILHRVERLNAIALRTDPSGDPRLVLLRSKLAELISTGATGSKREASAIWRLLEEVWEVQSSLFFQEASRAAGSVGRLSVGGGRTPSWAILIAPDLLLASWIALNGVDESEKATASFPSMSPPGLPSQVFELDPKAFFASDEELGVAVVRVIPALSHGYMNLVVPFSPLMADEGTVVLGEPLNIVHWTNAQSVDIVTRGTRLIRLPERGRDHAVQFTSRTAFLHEGAALFNDQWELVAIHRTSIPRIMKNGQIVNRRGAKWAGVDPLEVDWVAHEAVRASAIARLLPEKTTAAAGAAQPSIAPNFLPFPAGAGGPLASGNRGLWGAIGKAVGGAGPSAPGSLEDRTVDLLYATNRQAASTEDAYFSGERADTVTYGSAAVRIPEAHRLGKLELPFKLQLFSVTLFEQKLAVEEHFTIQNVDVLSLDDWREVINGSGLREALVFVHGFNTSFKDGLYRAAQIMWDLQYSGVPIYFSWPSRGRLQDYLYDRDSALGARDGLIEVLKSIRSSGVERINILAHSMGNLVTLDALANHSHSADPLGIAEMLMAAPDIDKDNYRKAAQKIRSAVSGMTLYASSADRALLASKRLAGDIDRAGDVSAQGPVVLDNIESIDVTAIGAEIFGLGHGFFSQARSVLNDINLVLRTGARPPNARSTEIRGMPTEQSPKWWRYVP